ncbi:uncharacterized protein PV09_09573 [Verruconis gallopava]|uniref:Mitochondrial escape protein 2 n=1 Tax=Verruconis gallopava TaxID=253628 RepID=A0A0D2AIB9_9PEZI|nr:uncharacterized protein PV09_09573 [Verruconis gallopava]KIV98663.1 hypothetical protein PV09_09573 [Verruconis gallopava]
MKLALISVHKRGPFGISSPYKASRLLISPSTSSQPAYCLRALSLEAGEGKSGHIHIDSNEGVLFFGNVFPLRFKWLLRLPWQAEDILGKMIKVTLSKSKKNPLDIVQNLKMPIKVTEVLPRFKEGGAFVKFTYGSSISAEEFETRISDYLKSEGIRPWWNPFDRVRASLVRGKPWVEDLYRLPSTRIRVEFVATDPNGDAVELSQEQLYSFFRPYGKLVDIIPQPPDSKLLPRFAYVDFANIHKAIMAKNCLHGIIIPEAEGGGKCGTVLRLVYERKAKTNWVWDWVSTHTRVVLPVAAALVAGVTVAIFDPIRTWFIKIHVTRQFDISDNKFYRWFKAQTTDLFHRRSTDEAGMDVIWNDRKANIDQIRGWLLESSDTFNIVQGPRGSGTRELVKEALKHRKYKLVVDCKQIQEARGDSATISAAAAEVGYRPVFSFMNNISGWVDLAAQGATGVKTGFSETLETQLVKIWNNTATALKYIALESRKENGKDANLSDDEYLEAHPERRPVVVIDNFLHKSQDNPIIYDKIAEWAARLTTANIAHVIFLTNDMSFSKCLNKALPDRVFRQISLSDASPAAAKQYVISHIDSEGDLSDDPENPGKELLPSQRRRDLNELDECIDSIGGRLSDLEFLARRIKAGETPRKAVREMIEQSASEIFKMYLTVQDDRSSRKWTAEQAWYVIRCLAESDSGILRYNEIILADVFRGSGDAILRALEQAELISIMVARNGRPRAVKPGKPIFLPAFKHLSEDSVLRSRLDLGILGELIRTETAAVEKYENELKLLGDLQRTPGEIVPRVRWLLDKLAASQKKVESYELERNSLKKIFKDEF